MDHRFLNMKSWSSPEKFPPARTLLTVIWRLLEPKITHGHLNRVRLYERRTCLSIATAKGAARTRLAGNARMKLHLWRSIVSRRPIGCIARSV